MRLSVVAATDRQRGVCCQIERPLSPASARKASGWIKAISDPTRLSMLATLYAAHEPVCICDFTAAYDLSQPTISHHMGKLRRAGLVAAQKRGVWVYYTVADSLPPPIAGVLEAILGKPADSRAKSAHHRHTA